MYILANEDKNPKRILPKITQCKIQISHTLNESFKRLNQILTSLFPKQIRKLQISEYMP